MNIETVALYARVSTRDKDQETENQLRQLREFVRKQDWKLIREYVDQKSGKNDDRPEFQAMLSAAARREFDLLMFWSLDRFSREGVLATLLHLQRLTSYGVEWKSYTEQYLDSCGVFKDAVLSILATIAKQERIRISERVAAGMERAKSAGRKLGRPRVVVNRDYVRQLRESGFSLGAIARELDLSITTVARICKR
jgi:DNA invertase Pin-like site-specific DNA recombinase